MYGYRDGDYWEDRCQNYYYQSWWEGEDFGAQGLFYTVANALSTVVMPIMPVEQMKALLDYIYFGRENIMDIINNTNQQVGPRVALSFGLIFSVISAMFALHYFFWKGKGFGYLKNRNQKIQTFFGSRAGLLIQLVLYFGLFWLLILVAVINGISVVDLHNGVTTDYNYKYGRYRENTYQAGGEMNCTFKRLMNKLDYQPQQNITWGYRTNTDSGIADGVAAAWRSKVGIDQLSYSRNYRYGESITSTYDLDSTRTMTADVVKSLKQLGKSNEQCDSQVNSLISSMEKINKDVDNLSYMMPQLQTQIAISVAKANETEARLKEEVQDIVDMQKPVIVAVKDRISAVHAGLMGAVNAEEMHTSTFKNIYAGKLAQLKKKVNPLLVTIATIVLISIPVVIILGAMVVAFLFCVAKLLFPLFSMILENFTQKPVKAPAKLKRYTRSVVNVGVCTAVYTIWVLWLLAAAFYWMSNPVTSSCQVLGSAEMYVPLFNQLSIPYTHYTPIKQRELTKNTIEYGQFLEGLQNYPTLYSTLNNLNKDGNKEILSVTDVMNDLDFDLYLQMTKNITQYGDFSIQFSKRTYEEYKADSDEFSMDSTALNYLASEGFLTACNQDGVRSVKGSLYKLNFKVSDSNKKNQELFLKIKNVVNMKEARKSMESVCDIAFSNLTSRFITVLQEYQINLKASSYPAKPIKDLHDRTWEVVCSNVGLPLNGVWLSFVLLALLMMSAGFILHKTARIIKESEEKAALDDIMQDNIHDDVEPLIAEKI